MDTKLIGSVVNLVLCNLFPTFDFSSSGLVAVLSGWRESCDILCDVCFFISLSQLNMKMTMPESFRSVIIVYWHGCSYR